MDIEMVNATEFYNQVASFYTAMIRFNKRQNREQEWIRKWRDQYHFDSALDAGCGTGSTALALAAEGIRTTGIDISDKMIVKAGENANHHNLESVEFKVSSFEDASHKINKRFDAIFCLGNSLVHVMPGIAMQKTIESFDKLLNPDGALVIQLLNYDKILKYKERIIDIHREGKIEFIRFYDFTNEVLIFNILHIDWSNEPVRHQLQTTQHYPYQVSEIQEQLKKYNFTIDEIYGTIKMEKYNPETSPNLVTVARKMT